MLVDSKVIYGGKSYGWAYICQRFPKCDAYVGCHPNTKRPLGRLANKELRGAKGAAHLLFDVLWQKKMKRDKCSKKMARLAGYRWLATQLGIKRSQCHIGMFDVEQCRKVVEVCAPYAERKA